MSVNTEIRHAANAYLEGLTRANEALMSTQSYPPLYDGQVRYSMGDVTAIPLAQTVRHRGRAACGPLAAYRAAELRRQGDARAVALVRPSRSGIPGRWHAVVVRGDGTVEDPSAILRGEAPAPEILGGWWSSLKKGLKAGLKGMASFGTGGASDLALKALGQKTSVEEGLSLLSKGFSKGKAGIGGVPKKAIHKEPPAKRPHINAGQRNGHPYAAVTIPLADTRITLVARGKDALQRALMGARMLARDSSVAAYVPRQAALALDAAAAAALSGSTPAVLGALGRCAGLLALTGRNTSCVSRIARSVPTITALCHAH